MEDQITNEMDRAVDATGDVDTLALVACEEAAIMPETTPSLEEFTVATGLTIDTMGSGDAPVMVGSILTARDIQDMILPDPSIVNLLPPLATPEETPDTNDLPTNDVFNPMFLDSLKDKKKCDDEVKDGRITKLTPEDIFEIQTFCHKNEEEPETKFDLTRAELLFRCESCQEMPISSVAVHTCSFGHQVCGSCYSNGARTCVVCKGHLYGYNVPLQNVLQRLRQNYPILFYKSNPPLREDVVDSVSRFYSLKPIKCPENGCVCQSSARSLLTHYMIEHKHVPVIDVPLFKCFKVFLPRKSVENVSGNVIAVVNLKITDKDIASEMLTDTMTCWVQCGATPLDKDDALAVWISCAYEESLMPPILYNGRVSTGDGYSSFAGQMISLQGYKGPDLVVANGQCLLVFPDVVKQADPFNGGMPVELKFYPR